MAVSATRNESNIAFLDLEMTGLNPERDVIIQAALIITNKDLEPLDEYVCDIWRTA
jgi:oligoribonuclease